MPKTDKNGLLKQEKQSSKTLLASLISIVIGLIIGAVVVWVVGTVTPDITPKGTGDGIKLILFGLFNTGRNASGALTFGFNAVNIGNMLFRATPIILTGLSVAIANQTGLFNIGAPGQYLMGTCVSLYLALSIPSDKVPPVLIWLIAFVAAMVAGALWGAIPGALKAFLNMNEVIACIMCNWIAANVVTWIFDESNLKNTTEGTKTAYIYKTSFNNVATAKLGLDKLFPGSQVNGGFIIAVVFCIIMWVVMSKTTFGYQLKACGSNRHAAKYAGIADKRNIVLSMAIAGALSSAAGALYYLAGNTEFFWSTYQSLPAAGFTGIAVALLAVNNPIGVIFSGSFMSMLTVCGTQLTYMTPFNEYITDVIIAVIVYISAFSLIIKMLLNRKKEKKYDKRDGGELKAPEKAADAQPAEAAGKEA